jgi:hypothetical protein
MGFSFGEEGSRVRVQGTGKSSLQFPVDSLQQKNVGAEFREKQLQL